MSIRVRHKLTHFSCCGFFCVGCAVSASFSFVCAVCSHLTLSLFAATMVAVLSVVSLMLVALSVASAKTVRLNCTNAPYERFTALLEMNGEYVIGLSQVDLVDNYQTASGRSMACVARNVSDIDCVAFLNGMTGWLVEIGLVPFKSAPLGYALRYRPLRGYVGQHDGPWPCHLDKL